MKSGIKALLPAFILILFSWYPAVCQQEPGPVDRAGYVELVKQSYGLDQTLVNGFQFFNRYNGCRGVPYLGIVGFAVGEMTISGKVYAGVPIRYNLISQRLEIEYRSPYLGYNWMEVVTDHVEEFRLLGHTFKKLNLEDTGPIFYQVIEAGPFTCYIHWEKDLQPVQNDQVFTHEFTRAEPSFLLVMNEEMFPVDNRKDLRRVFPEHVQKEISRLLRKNKFKLKHASPEEMTLNMIQVAALYEGTPLP